MLLDPPMQQQQQQMDSQSGMMVMEGPYDGNPDYMDFNDPYSVQGPPGMMQPLPGQDPYFMDSEYGRNESGAPSRQDSLSSLDRNLDISVKKIEEMEDEYGKMKMALLSDLDQDPDHDPAFLLSPCLPVAENRPPPPARQRSRDNLESIFGGGNQADRPASLNLDSEGTPNQPHMPLFLNLTTESRSSDHTTTNTDPVQSYLSSSFDPDQHEQDYPGTRAGPRNNLVLIEEPFPVCVTPEMELSLLGGGMGMLQTAGRGNTGIAGGGHIGTIEEVPEEEEGSPTTGDGVSRRRTGRTTRTHSQKSRKIIFSLHSITSSAFLENHISKGNAIFMFPNICTVLILQSGGAPKSSTRF